ncbi:MAG: hypothetical protein ING29_13065 [Azospirillum sp.]|nr:hypothetical protein [Azospirillum sp.]
MPRVPAVTGQSVMPNAVPAPFQRVQATPADFGAGIGQALERTGGQVAQVGDRLKQREIEISRENDALAAEQAYAAFSDQERVFLNDPERGIFSRRGGNAIRAYEDATKWWDESTRAAVEGMANPNQQRLLRGILLRRRDASLDGVARHVARERQTYIGEVTDARVKGLVADAAAAYNDEGKVNGIILEADGALREWGRRMGQAPELIDLNARAARSSIRRSVIERMAIDNPMAAMRYYEANKGDLDGTTQQAIEKALKGAVDRQKGNMAAAAVFPRGAALEGGDIRERVWRIEGGEAQNPEPGQTARGGGITDGTWRQYAGRLGLTDAQRGTREGFNAVWTAYQQDATAAIGRPLTPGEQYAAWFLGIGGAKAFMNAPRNADAQEVYRQAAGAGIADQAFRVNGAMMRPGMTVGEVLDAVQGKVVGGTAEQRGARIDGTLEAARRRLDDMRQRGELTEDQLQIAQTRLRQDFGEQRQAEEDTRREALREIRKKIATSKSLDTLTPNELAVLSDDPMEKERWLDWIARAGRVTTDFPTYNRINNMRGTDEFETLDLTSPEFATKLSPEDLKRFSDMQVAQRRGDNSAAVRAERLVEQQRAAIVRERLREAGIDPTPRDTDASGSEKVRRFNDALDASIAGWKASNPNKIITIDDMKRLADSLLIQGELLTGSWWRPDPNRRAFEVFDMSPEERGRFDIRGFLSDAKDRARVARVTGVPVDQIDAYANALKAANVPVTPDNLAALWRRTGGR